MAEMMEYTRKRSQRLAEARARGRHSKREWKVLHDLFGHCVSCGCSAEELIGGELNKDHIEPIFIGGCDCIANLQPMCRHCNSGKGSWSDLREAAMPGWCAEFIERMAHG